MVECSQRFGDNELVEQFAGPMGNAGGIGEERLDGAGGFGRVVVEPAGQSLQLGRALGQLGDSAIVAQAQPALDRAEDYLRRCDEQAEAVRGKIGASRRPGPSREELLARARAKGLNL
jgi:hypothetical protein